MRPFAFAEDWHVPHPPAAVLGVLVDVEHYPAWWPQVVGCLKLGEGEGIVLCRSTLPYTLELHTTEAVRTEQVLEARLSGDLDGWVRWRVSPEGSGTRVHFAQEVVVTDPRLRLAAYVGRPVLRWNHARMLAGARRGLSRRLLTPDEER